MWADTVATAGGLVFTADHDGDLVALDAKAGAELWHFYMGSNASPGALAVNGEEYIAIAAGTTSLPSDCRSPEIVSEGEIAIGAYANASLITSPDVIVGRSDRPLCRKVTRL